MNIAIMKNSKIVVLIMTSLSLAACGGGSGESGGGSDSGSSSTQLVSSNAAANDTVTTTHVVPATTAQSTVSSTEELVVTDTFLFSSNFKVDVSVTVPATFNHLTVCYAKNGSKLPDAKADYDNCLLRADLDSGAFNGALLLTNDTDYLVVSAWDYSDVANPAVTYWNRELDGDLIRIN